MKRRVFLCVLILLLFTGAAYAYDTMYLDGLPLNTAMASDGNTYYIGPARGNLNLGLNNPNSTYAFTCDDFFPRTYVPGTYPVNVSTFDSLMNVKFRDTSNNPLLTEYKQAAWLVQQLQTNPSSVAPIQFAIWNIFTPTAPDYAGQEAWITAATNAIALSNYNFSDVRVYTPISLPNSNQQEFMSAAPIPAAIWLFGAGLVGLVGVRRKFRK
jgi:hypothetical protein